MLGDEAGVRLDQDQKLIAGRPAGGPIRHRVGRVLGVIAHPKDDGVPTGGIQYGSLRSKHDVGRRRERIRIQGLIKRIDKFDVRVDADASRQLQGRLAGQNPRPPDDAICGRLAGKAGHRRQETDPVASPHWGGAQSDCLTAWGTGVADR